MYVTAVNPFLNPYDIARVSVARPRNEQAESRNPAAPAAPSQERVIQGEVLSRQPVQNENISSTRDNLNNRQFNSDQSGFGFNARQAVNTYIGNQLQGDRIDQQNSPDEDALIDVYV